MSERLTFAFELTEDQLEQLVEAVTEHVLERTEGNGSRVSPWLSLDDAADYLGISTRTLERAVASGKLRSTTLGRRRLFHRDALDAIAATGEETAPTVPPRRRRRLG